MSPETLAAPAHTATRPMALLGPQHTTPTLRAALEAIGATGPIMLVAAGWEEREAETGELEAHLGSEVQNLGLWPACEEAFGQDSDLRAQMFARHDRMLELSRIYRIRLGAELSALRRLLAETDPGSPNDLIGPALAPAFEALQALDQSHLARVAEVNDEVFGAMGDRDAVRVTAERVAEQIAQAGTLLVAGGHVGILYNRLRLFGVLDALPESAAVVGWSAGAMVLTERILLFHDSPPQGAGDAELLGPGLGLATGIAALPHAGSRLDLDDAARVALLARRMGEGAIAVALDGGERVTSSKAGWIFDGQARVLCSNGSIVTPESGSVAGGDCA